MQILLPYKSFEKSAKCLDDKRLFKQIEEACTIIGVLDGVKHGTLKNLDWLRPPAVVMWWGYLEALKEYYNIMVSEWRSRGNKDKIDLYSVDNFVPPPWLDDQRLTKSHRSFLLSENYSYYTKFFCDDEPFDKIFWPSLNRDYVDILCSYNTALRELPLCCGMI